MLERVGSALGTGGTSLLITCSKGTIPHQLCSTGLGDSDLSLGANKSQCSIDWGNA